MATYAIGDIQGCYKTFRGLLEVIDFDEKRDRLWLVGDLVNRGPRSLQVLRWVYRNRKRVTAVLGNHDLYLLARATGTIPKKRDTIGPIVSARDRDELLEWLLRRPLLHREGKHLMVHAGLLPSWSADEAESRARDAAKALASGRLPIMERKRKKWKDRGSAQSDRMRETLEVMTRVRMLDSDGRPSWQHKGPPADAPDGQRSWFDARGDLADGVTVVFGHWAALGRHIAPGYVALDTGCVWGGELTAFRLEDKTVFAQENID